MYKIIIIYMIFSGAVFAQDFKNLVLKDTIVLMIDKSHILDDSTVKIVKNDINKTFILFFSDVKYLRFLTHNGGLFERENVKICRSRLKNTKYKIFTLDNLLKNGFDNVAQVILSKKIVIYIIDVKINKRRRVLLKRAYMQYYPKIEM